MKISAKDKGTGKENTITIKSDSGLSKTEIERMIREAEENAEADKKQRQLIEARNNAEAALNTFDADIDKYGDQITPDEKAKVDAAVDAVNQAIKGDDVEAIQNSIPKLYEAMNPITAKKSEAEKKDEPTADDNVVDAEVKEAV